MVLARRSKLRVSKNFFSGGHFFVFAEYLCNRSPKIKTKNIKNYSSILAMVNHWNWLDDSPPLNLRVWKNTQAKPQILLKRRMLKHGSNVILNSKAKLAFMLRHLLTVAPQVQRHLSVSAWSQCSCAVRQSTFLHEALQWCPWKKSRLFRH